MNPVARAVQMLAGGGIVGLPTDTVYGIAALPSSETAVRRLYELKQRPGDKPIALLVGSVIQAQQLVKFLPGAKTLAEAHWPGPLTLVLSVASDIPTWVGDPQRRTIGVRMPDLGVTLEILARTGPLAVTSANLSGESPVQDDAAAYAVFGDSVDYYVPGHCPGGAGSTVVDATSDELVVLRAGPIDLTSW